MTNVDQFESMFRSASRDVFRHERIELTSILIITDLDEADAQSLADQIKQFLTVISDDKQVSWRTVTGAEFQSAGDLLTLVESAAPDLICTYRNLHSDAWKWPYSLGTHVDLLTQHTSVPIMLLPHPLADRQSDHAYENTDTVMAITDHLTGDHRLVNYALHFAQKEGTVWLTHIEDEATFDRYVESFSKIPSIDTEEASTALRAQRLKEPRDYIEGCVELLQEAGTHVTVEPIVQFGHHLSEYKRLIEQHHVDLLVLNTKDDDQLAMHGMAYALAVELRQIPLLML